MHGLRFLPAFLFLLEIAGCIHNLHQPPSVSLFSTLLPPCFLSLHLPFSLLAIWLLQLGSLAYCRLCRCHQKLFTFQHFDAVSHVYKLQCRHFAQPPKQKQRGQALLLLWCVSGGRDGMSFSLMFSSHPHSPQLHHTSSQWKVFDTVMVMMECFFSAKWTLNIHAVQGRTEYVIFLLFKG